MLNKVLGALVLAAAIAASSTPGTARGGGGGLSHSVTTVGAAPPTTTTSTGTRTPTNKSIHNRLACWNGVGHRGPGGPTIPRCGSNGGATASMPTTCKAGGEGCQRQH